MQKSQNLDKNKQETDDKPSRTCRPWWALWQCGWWAPSYSLVPAYRHRTVKTAAYTDEMLGWDSIAVEKLSQS